ncbi:MAG: HAD-IA family hydrolase [Sutterellaceae bacterium]|nr:HAD-IA family hydrolase [Sutterellaceae bacterium]MDD7441277.1 HAD-IA family hydrolase [Sutterellaceae bacterium]MDY2868848.1 HAD-IA family hydrolase [Mesosutterella sp.]
MQGKERPFELYVFDWDGTCMDTTPFIAEAIKEACRALGLPVPSDELAKSVIGLGYADCMSRIAPGCPASELPRFNEAYWQAYIRQEEFLTSLHPGMRELLSAMKRSGLWMAIATGKSRRGISRILGKTDAAGFFVASRTADESTPKPAPDMLLELSDECCVPLERMVMVGDAVHDLRMAENAGVASVGVTWGAAKREELLGFKPRAVVDTVPELARALGVADLCPGA